MTIESYSDGSGQNSTGFGSASFIIVKDNSVLHMGSTLLKDITNNEAEYAALTMAVKWLRDNTRGDLVCNVDSELVMKQVTGQYDTKQPGLVIARTLLREELQGRKLTVQWVPRTNKFIQVADRMNRKVVREVSQ